MSYLRKRPRPSRRAFLGGAAAVLSLPFLESLMGKPARADDAAPLRMIAYYVPNGMHMPAWTPKVAGSAFELSPILGPLAAVKDKTLVLTGLANLPAIPDDVGDHATGTAAFLTCRHVVETSDGSVNNGVSVDQLAAAAIGAHTPLASLQLGMDAGNQALLCPSGFACAYVNNVSWASPTQPLPKLTDPAVVFDLLFQGFDAQATAEEKARRKKYKLSVLDHVLGDAQSLHAKLGATDRAKLDEYMTGVYELEQRINLPQPECSAVAPPLGALDFPTQMQVMADLMVMALQCDVTRVISFMLGNGSSNRVYDFLGITDSHHNLSHHLGAQSKLDDLETIGTWEVAQLAYLLERMDAVQEGEGTMLDNSVVVFSSEIEDGDSHAHINLPVVLAGGCGGAFETGRHVVYDDQPPIADLYVSLLQALGASATSFGADGTAPLEQLT